MKTCEVCKFWSDRIARVVGQPTEPFSGQFISYTHIEALCLNPESVCHNKYVWRGCGKHQEGESVDLYA